MITFLFRTTNSSPSFVHKLMKSTTKKRNYQVSLVGNTRAKDQRRSLEGPASRKWIILLYKKFQTLHALRKLLLEEKLFSDVFFLTSIDGFSQISQIHKFSFFKTIHSRLGKRNSVNFHREVGIDKFLKKKKKPNNRQFNKEITKRKAVEKKLEGEPRSIRVPRLSSTTSNRPRLASKDTVNIP